MLFEATFGPSTGHARDARAGCQCALEKAEISEEVTTEVVAVLGELVANAVRHARTEFTVAVLRHESTLRVEVFDRNTRPPALRGLDVDSTSGRGLHIVAGLARDWGWQTADDDGVSGKTVWAEFALD